MNTTTGLYKADGEKIEGEIYQYGRPITIYQQPVSSWFGHLKDLLELDGDSTGRSKEYAERWYALEDKVREAREEYTDGQMTEEALRAFFPKTETEIYELINSDL